MKDAIIKEIRKGDEKIAKLGAGMQPMMPQEEESAIVLIRSVWILMPPVVRMMEEHRNNNQRRDNVTDSGNRWTITPDQ